MTMRRLFCVVEIALTVVVTGWCAWLLGILAVFLWRLTIPILSA
ncbi:hypothetical protein ACP26C_05520 [Franconibacter helveticus 513]|nr:hypothetical protein [Franconibacter helveticus]